MIKIRKAKISDVEELKVLHDRSSLSDGNRHYSKEEMKAITDFAGSSKIKKDLQSKERITLIAEIGKDIAGYGVFDIKKSWVWSLFVDPKFKNKGVGKALLQEGEKAIKNQDGRFIGLYARLSAKDFYIKLGFKVMGHYIWKVDSYDIKLTGMRKKLS